ncbi:MAG: FAD-binding oxidoreductase [Rhodospirillales bacterium]|nr:FAD-binding oxidoreductase [Rhodospirillales bacterium]
MRHEPYWWDDAPIGASTDDALPPRVDVAVIGAGYTGLSAALTIASGGRSVAVLEAGLPGVGASSRNGGMCSEVLKPSFATLSKRYGKEHALALIKEAREAFDFLPHFLEEEGIDCNYVRCGGFTGALKQAQYDAMARETEALGRTTGLDAVMIPKSELRDEVGTDLYVGGRLMHRRGGLHPAKYHAGLLARTRARGAAVIGNCAVTGLDRDASGFRLTTARGPVTARDVVVATNGYTGPATPSLRRRVIPVTSYMIATAPLSPNLMATLMPRGRMLTDGNRLLCYFRPSPDNTRVLFGGRPAYTDIGPVEAARRLQAYMTTVFPELAGVELSHSWSGFIAYTFDRLPHVGFRDGVHYAMGYCGSGVVMSTWLGRKAGLRVLDKPEARSAFADIEHPTNPLYHGKPWFLPLVQAWYQGADMIGR